MYSLRQAEFAARSVPRHIPSEVEILKVELSAANARVAKLLTANEKLSVEVAFLRAKLDVHDDPRSLRHICNVVCQFYGITYFDLIGDRRARKIMRPRHVAFYLSRKHTTLSFAQIGRLIGDRDHSTTVHAYQKIERQLKSDAALALEISELERRLAG